ncbi:MAG: ion transporter [Candidatus Melainabacteria bacterium]|nr:ion transporter [Candidatus Melainabacteria bacterium]
MRFTSRALSSMKFRRLVYKQLYQRSWEHEGLSILNRIIFGLICLSVFLVIIETEKPFYHAHRQLFHVIDFVVGLCFATEYALRVWSAGERKAYRGFTGRLKYMMTPYALIDLLVIVPFFITSSSNIFIARFIRLFRILAIAKAARYSQAFDLVSEAVHSRRHELIFSLVLAAIVLLTASTVMWVVEPDEEFRSIPRALWWGIMTLTTVGYGDVCPQTIAGKVISGVTAVCGIGLIAMPAGILAAAFGEAINRHKNKMEKRRWGRVSRNKRVKLLRQQRNRNANVEDVEDPEVFGGPSPSGRHVVLQESSGTDLEVVCEHCGHDKFVMRPKNGTAYGDDSEGDFDDEMSDDFSPTGPHSVWKKSQPDTAATGNNGLERVTTNRTTLMHLIEQAARDQRK